MSKRSAFISIAREIASASPLSHSSRSISTSPRLVAHRNYAGEIVPDRRWHIGRECVPLFHKDAVDTLCLLAWSCATQA
jgi:hypothetical protein